MCENKKGLRETSMNIHNHEIPFLKKPSDILNDFHKNCNNDFFQMILT